MKNLFRFVVVGFLLLNLLYGSALAQIRCGTIAPQNSSKQDQEKMELFNKKVQEKSNKDEKMAAARVSNSSESVLLIPVVVHIVHRSTDALNSGSNLSITQIQSQIAVLNADYRRRNSDAANTPPYFADRVADARIQFYLACTDPSGNPTNGITRTSTTTTYFTNNNNVKRTVNGGHDPWNTNQYLNIWVCDLRRIVNTTTVPVLGYAQFPENFSASPNTDGVVCNYQAFGVGSTYTNFNGGRTATHEIGHWLGVYHIWGKAAPDNDTSCSDSDDVSDTPNQAAAHYNCTPYPTAECGSPAVMAMNYMDYNDDACMNAFTLGQKARMRGTLDLFGYRANFQRSQYTVSGSGVMCASSSTTFSVAGTNTSSVTWSTSSNLYVSNGQGSSSVQITASGNGDGWVEATVNNGGPCSNASIPVRMSVWVGAPGYVNVVGVNFTVSSGTNNICAGREYCAISSATGATNFTYSWPTYNSYLVTSTTDVNNDKACFATNQTGSQTLQINAQNTCGTSQRSVYFQVSNCFSAYRVYPNPASDQITIEFDDATEAQTLPDQIELYSEQSTQPVKSANVQEMFASKSLKDGKAVVLPVKELPRGIYYLHIKNNRRIGKELDAIRIVLK